MRVEVPYCARCCFCMPLRMGIIIFGYFNLVFFTSVLALEVWLGYGEELDSYTMMTYKGVDFYSEMWLTLIIYSLEIIFNILLLIGVHMKMTKLISAYYYYGISTTLAAFVIFMVVALLYWKWYFYMLQCCLAFSGLVINIYLLLLIRSELSKSRYKEGQHSYVNHISEVTIDPFTGEGRNPL